MVKPTHAPAGTGSLLGVGLDDMVYALRRARKSVSIATPFLSRQVAALLVRESYGAYRRRLLIALNEAAVAGGYLDPRGVQEFIEAGFEVRSLRNLHAKVVLSDERWGLVGSGNLTVAGSNGGNAELGVVLGPSQARTAQRRHFDQWWKAAEALDERYLHSLQRRRRPALPERQQRAGRGGIFAIDPGTELAAFIGDPSRGSYWLKIMHHRPERAKLASWRGDFWISDVHRLRPSDGEPLLKPSYKVGDRLVIYLSREGRRACPAIVRVTRTPRYEPARVRREGWPDDYKKWSWVTEVVGERAVALDRGPTLADLDVSSASVRQHSRIRLSHAQFQRALAKIPIVS
jgi:hypothetical protein